MEKRKTSELIKEIYDMIKKNPGISMSMLERKIGTNPDSLLEHCKMLQHFNLIKIEELENTRKLFLKK